jgi:SAM-dependent methyltransferase
MKKDFWNYSIEIYKRMKSPWRPSRQEIAIMESQVAGWMGERINKSGIHALVLGISPEIVDMTWPAQTRLTVVDNSEAMARAFWPSDSVERRQLVQADWMNLPFESRQFDAVIGDGVFNVLSYPEGYQHFAQILSCNLKPDGLFLTRVQTQFEPKENPEDISARYLSGQITDYHELRFRFITAMQPDVYQGVFSSKEIIDSHLAKFGISLSELYRTTGYDPPPMEGGHSASAGAPPMKATYPTQNEFLISMREHFQVMELSYGNHPLGHQCPIFAFRPTGYSANGVGPTKV